MGRFLSNGLWSQAPEPQQQLEQQLGLDLEQQLEQLGAPLDEDPAMGAGIALTFAAPRLGLYLEDRPAPEAARNAGWPGASETAIGRFNSVGPEEEGHVAGEAEARGVLALGDVVVSIHGVDVRGLGAEDTVRLVMAAPRPFEMRFLRRR